MLGSLRGLLIVFGAISTRAVSRLTSTFPRISTTVAYRLIRSFNLLRLIALLPSLQIGQTPRLVVDIPDLLITLHVERSHPLSRRRIESFLKVRVQTTPAGLGFISDAIAGVNPSGSVGGLVLAVEVRESGGEAGRETVLVVERDGLLDRTVADDVAVGKVLSDNARARLVFLGDVVVVLGFVARSGFAAGNVVKVVGARDMDLGGAKLGVIEEESSLGGTEEIVS